MAKVEGRAHLGPGEIEIDSTLYGIMLVPQHGSRPIMTNKLYGDKDKALADVKAKWDGFGYVVRINGTHA